MVCNVITPLVTLTVTPPGGVPGGCVAVPEMDPTPVAIVTSTPVKCSPGPSERVKVSVANPGAVTVTVNDPGVGRLFRVKDPTLPCVRLTELAVAVPVLAGALPAPPAVAPAG